MLIIRNLSLGYTLNTKTRVDVFSEPLEMGNLTKIEVFIKEKEIETGKVHVGRRCTFKQSTRKETIMSEDDKKTLEIVQKLAKENGLKVKVHNVSSFGGRLKARRRGVENTPAVIIGEQKIEGMPTKEQILGLLHKSGISPSWSVSGFLEGI